MRGASAGVATLWIRSAPLRRRTAGAGPLAAMRRVSAPPRHGGLLPKPLE